MNFYTDRLASALNHSPVARYWLRDLSSSSESAVLQTRQYLSHLCGRARTEMVVHVLNSHVRLAMREIRTAAGRKHTHNAQANYRRRITKLTSVTTPGGRRRRKPRWVNDVFDYFIMTELRNNLWLFST